MGRVGGVVALVFGILCIVPVIMIIHDYYEGSWVWCQESEYRYDNVRECTFADNYRNIVWVCGIAGIVLIILGVALLVLARRTRGDERHKPRV